MASSAKMGWVVKLGSLKRKYRIIIKAKKISSNLYLSINFTIQLYKNVIPSASEESKDFSKIPRCLPNPPPRWDYHKTARDISNEIIQNIAMAKQWIIPLLPVFNNLSAKNLYFLQR